MSSIAFFGALELGLIYGIVAFGVFLTFRVLDFPDLTVESSFPLGGAIVAVCILAGWILGRQAVWPPSAVLSPVY